MLARSDEPQVNRGELRADDDDVPVFGSQDHERRKLLLGQLRELADREFRRVFVISHTDDVVEHRSLRIDVTRERRGQASVADGPRAG